MSHGTPLPESMMAAAAGPAPALTVAGVEVTQAIQNERNAVQLIAGKTTVVRVYLDAPSGSSANVRGEIRVKPIPNGAEQIVTSLNSITVDPALNGKLRSKRENVQLSLNFVLPAKAVAPGQLSIRVSGLSDRDTGAAVGCSNCQNALQVQFQQAPPLRVRLIGLRYAAGNPPQTHAPKATDYSFINSWLRRAYPVAEVITTNVAVDANMPWPFTCNQVNAQIAAIRALDVAAGTDRRTHYYGLVSDGGGFMRGCANVPATANPAAVGSGPTGKGSFGWDFDGCYGDWYTAHELGHTFGRKHPGFCNGNSADDSAFPFPNGQLAKADGSFVGFDVGDPALGIPVAALPGTAHHDVMTYCEKQWMSSYTYEGILKRLNEENALGSGVADGDAGPDPAAVEASARLNVKMSSGSLISVVGSVDLTERTGRILYVNPVERALTPVQEGEGRATIRVLTDAGTQLGEYPAALLRNTCAIEGEHETAVLDTVIPRHSEAARLELLLDGQSIDVYHASASPVNVGAPRANTIKGLLNVESAAAEAGPVNPAVRYNVQVSTDEGATWQTVAVGRQTPDVTIDPDDFGAEPGNLLVRVSATDGFRISEMHIQPLRSDEPNP